MRASRIVSVAVLAAWLVQMGYLLRSVLRAAPVPLAADLARYGGNAQWKAVYYRGDKIGFMVGQTLPTSDGFDLMEDGQLQMSLLGATTAARIKTRARVDASFALRSFSFSLDPGSGPVVVEGRLDGRRLTLTVTTAGSTRTEVRDLPEPPSLALNLSRRLAASGLETGKKLQVTVFDPATMRNAPMDVEVRGREVVMIMHRPVPAFRVQSRFAGVTSISWITDVGEVIKEESPLGLVVLKESQERATALAVTSAQDMLRAAAIEPSPQRRIDDPMAVERLRVRLQDTGLEPGPDLQGAGQTVSGDVWEVRNTQRAQPGPPDPEAARYLGAEPFIESDAPEIVAAARQATQGLTDSRARAQRLVRYVNSIIEKRPTVSLPSALEVLRTRVGDCNEHTALLVALARASGIPARIAVGLVAIQSAFYYHAWAEVYLEGPGKKAMWLPVDPTLNQFPADATHLRLARGGLDKQAVILPLMGRARMTILELEERPEARPVLVGRAPTDIRPLEIAIPRRDGSGRTCWSRPQR